MTKFHLHSSLTLLLLICAITSTILTPSTAIEAKNNGGATTTSKDSIQIKMTLNVVNGNKMFPLTLEPSDLIETLKAIIVGKEWIPMDQQRLLFNGQEMQNGHTFAEYSVVPGSTIDLIKRG